jgi:hypothetical protein
MGTASSIPSPSPSPSPRLPQYGCLARLHQPSRGRRSKSKMLTSAQLHRLARRRWLDSKTRRSLKSWCKSLLAFLYQCALIRAQAPPRLRLGRLAGRLDDLSMSNNTHLQSILTRTYSGPQSDGIVRRRECKSSGLVGPIIHTAGQRVSLPPTLPQRFLVAPKTIASLPACSTHPP